MKLLLGILAIAAQIFVIGSVCSVFVFQIKELINAIKKKITYGLSVRRHYFYWVLC